MQPADLALEAGVSHALARARAAMVSRVSYAVSLHVSDDLSEPIAGSVVVRFSVAAAEDVVFDFASAEASLRGTRVDGQPAIPRLLAEHIVIPAALLRAGVNTVEFEFVADPAVLNRQTDFIYSLFVPARARLAFPCFDQPDLKAHFTLTLRVPRAWSAVSNTPVDSELLVGDERQWRFCETELLPTYLFAFVAGSLNVESGIRAGKVFRVWHREHDRGLVQRNLDAIFDLHANAVAWLESYTSVPYAFGQFEMVLVPSFQFSGMEHPGAILYNAGRILLEASASEHDYLTRASLIAHETAHMWFGDLVTMRWFDDVWLKEVFANFVADKIVAEAFPTRDHDLRFFLAHHWASYAVDRTTGANAIRQPLENLSEAGQLYGPIIYHKAPVVFRQLELLLGRERFREGVKQYLAAYAFGNATWDDLLTILTTGVDLGLREWSAAWVDEPGRPTVSVECERDIDHRLDRVVIRALGPTGQGSGWSQQIRLTLGHQEHVEHTMLGLDGRTMNIAISGDKPVYLLAGGGGLGYARAPLDPDSRAWLIDHVEQVPDALTRAVAWMSLWDELLDGTIPGTVWIQMSLRALTRETEAQNIERLLMMTARTFWLFVTATEREALAPAIETVLIARLRRAAATEERALWFAALRQLTITAAGCEWLARVWQREDTVPGLPLQESDETTLALELAVRAVPAWRGILTAQHDRIQDSERRARFAFLAPALSNDDGEREAAFERLTDRGGRTREPWVLTLLHYLNHPLRQAHARRYIRPGLDLLPEIMASGDIFFPSRWLEALLGGHASPAAAEIVRTFLAEREDLLPRLRNAVLIAGDLLFRASR